MTASSKFLAQCLFDEGATRVVGVPDSVLAGFCLDAADVFGFDKHLIAANEGSAVGAAIGHHLATGEVSVVYMQNSGLGNAVNPLISLASGEVYSIPMMLVIGWRGMPGIEDEPQHVLQGRVTQQMLECLGIPYQTVHETDEKVSKQVRDLLELSKRTSAPVALLIPKGSLRSDRTQERLHDPTLMSREEALQEVLENLDPGTLFVSTTGMLSREFYENTDGLKSRNCFMCVGGMGHAGSVALGIAQELRHKRVVCLDGDGAAIMHLGAMASIGKENCPNLIHIVFNNGVHDSVGGQPTTNREIEFSKIAHECGYRLAVRASSRVELVSILKDAEATTGVSLIEIIVNPGNRADIGRPKEDMIALKRRMRPS